MVDVTSKWDEERTAELHRGAGSQCGSQASMEGSGGIWTTQNFPYKHVLKKMLKVQGKCPNVVREASD